jgi:hypothetical protein
LKIEILTPNLRFINSQAFLYPLIIWKDQIKNEGIDYKIKHSINDLSNSDLLLVDSKFFRDYWLSNELLIYENFCNFRKKTKKLVYVDTTDSTGWIQTQLFDYIDFYWKSQLLKNRDDYFKSFYGNRIFTHYYHKNYDVNDDYPEYSLPIKDKKHIHKLKVSWNFGLFDYSIFSLHKMYIYKISKYQKILNFSKSSFQNPLNKRLKNINCRFNTNYLKNTIAFQRLKITELLVNQDKKKILSKAKYFKELSNTKIVLSPFGNGELCFRDFETFMAGAILIKPNMSHVDTWPNFYQENFTYKSFSWDMNELINLLDQIINNYENYIEIAINGQNSYKKYTIDIGAKNLFIEHFKSLLQS